MEFVLIKQGSPEWEFMWEWLAKHPINEGLEEPSVALYENEAWMYMGSYNEGDEYIHTFRHRNHPLTKGLINKSLKGNKQITEDQIQKKVKI